MTKNIKGFRKFIALCLITIATYLGLMGDYHLGKMYFDNLCEKESGIKIYKTVSLPSQNVEDDVDLKDIKDRFFTDVVVLAGRYMGWNELHPYNKKYKIHLFHKTIVDTKEDFLISEEKNFSFKGGWLNNAVSLPNGQFCYELSDDIFDKTFIK